MAISAETNQVFVFIDGDEFRGTRGFPDLPRPFKLRLREKYSVKWFIFVQSQPHKNSRTWSDGKSLRTPD